MKYIKVTNYSTNVNRINLEKLGLSTKRNSDETIGQFGSGIKFAPIAAVRKGLRWIFTGEDSKGKYVLEYVVKDDDGIPCIFYKYEDYEKPSSFTADAGLLSWEEPFQILREVIANAIDQSTMSDLPWSLDIVDESEISANDGEFSVYITADDEMLKIVENFDKYFSTNRKPIYDVPGHFSGFKLYEPIDDNMRVYCKGVLVYTTANHEEMSSSKALFDYEFANLELNEERTVKSLFDLNSKIGRALNMIEDRKMVRNLIESVMDDENDSLYEFNYISEWALNQTPDSDYKKEMWKDSFNEVMPNHVLIGEKDNTINKVLSIKARGFIPAVIEKASKFGFLTAKGVPTALAIVGENFQYSYSDDLILYDDLITAVEILADVVPETSEAYPSNLRILEDETDCMAMTINMTKDKEDRLVLISDDVASSGNLESIIATLIHEFDHFSTGLDDGDLYGRSFRDVADKRMAQLIIQIYKLKYGEDSI
ncbi:MAG: hypothetical protein RL463_1115 [Bacteroidota bacterium]